MQECFLVDRAERLGELVWLVRATRPAPRRLLDIGCGTGSIAALLLEAFPEAEVLGLDADPTLVALARGPARCSSPRRRRIRMARRSLHPCRPMPDDDRGDARPDAFKSQQKA